MPSCPRRFSFAVSLLLSALICFGGAVPAAEFTTKQIAKLIEQLGDNDFKVRENASKNLWQAGAAAESALEHALHGNDPEVVRRARELLEKFRWGIYPDTPADIVALIRAYQSSEGTARTEVVKKLLHGGDAGLRAVRKIAKAVQDDNERKKLSTLVLDQLPVAFLHAVTEGKCAAFEKLLEFGHEDKSIDLTQYAAYWLLRGKLAERIAHFRSQVSKEPDDKWLAQTLAYLHRANGDWMAARKAAEQSGRADLLEGILQEMGDWKALSARAENTKTDLPAEKGSYPIADRENTAEKWGYRAAYARLADRPKEFENAIGELRKFADQKGKREDLVFVAAKALLLNDRPNEGLQLLAQISQQTLRFEILCSRLKFGEAMKIVEERGPTENKERAQLEIFTARTLYLLGEKDKAQKLFARLAGQIKDGANPSWIGSLLETEYRLGLKDQAFDHFARALRALPPEKQIYWDKLFPNQKEMAEVWGPLLWMKYRKDEGEAAALKRLRDLMDGKADPKEVKAWIEQAVRGGFHPAMRELLPRQYQAMAEAAAAVGLDDLAYGLLEKADNQKALIRLGDWLAAKKQWSKAAERYQQAWKKELTPPANRERVQLDPLPLYLAGDALVRAGREKEGKKLIEQAHWLPLADTDTRFSFLRTLAERGHAEAARRETDLLLRVSEPNTYYSGSALRRLAVAALARKDYLKAAEGFEQSMLRCLHAGTSFVSSAGYVEVPAQIHQLRACGLLAAGKLEEALKQAGLALTVAPGYVDLPIALVPELERRGHKKEATDLFNRCYGVYEKVCRDYPRCGWARNSIAWLCVCCRRHLDEALTHAEKAVELAPTHAGYLDTLAEVHFQRGDKDKAIALQKRAIELDPKRVYFRKQLKRLQAGDPNAERPPENDD